MVGNPTRVTEMGNTALSSSLVTALTVTSEKRHLHRISNRLIIRKLHVVYTSLLQRPHDTQQPYPLQSNKMIKNQPFHSLCFSMPPLSLIVSHLMPFKSSGGVTPSNSISPYGGTIIILVLTVRTSFKINELIFT